MNVEHINLFVQGAQRVLYSICGERPSLGNLHVLVLPCSFKPAAVQIQILGDVQGSVVYHMDVPLACYIASRMLNQTGIHQLDEISRSAVSELSNIISGAAATLLAGKERKVDITPPSFFLGTTKHDFDFSHINNKKMVAVPLMFEDGNVFEIAILLEEH